MKYIRELLGQAELNTLPSTIISQKSRLPFSIKKSLNFFIKLLYNVGSDFCKMVTKIIV